MRDDCISSATAVCIKPVAQMHIPRRDGETGGERSSRAYSSYSPFAAHNCVPPARRARTYTALPLRPVPHAQSERTHRRFADYRVIAP